MQVYLINLDRDRDRLAHMREQLRGVPFTRAPAVDGTKNPETTKRPDPLRAGLPREPSKRPGGSFSPPPDAHACFLEDDLHIWPGFEALVDDDAWVPARRPFGEARHLFPDGEARRAPTRPAADARSPASTRRHESSAAYLLSRAGAERYLELTARPTLPADYALFPEERAPAGTTHLSARRPLSRSRIICCLPRKAARPSRPR